MATRTTGRAALTATLVAVPLAFCAGLGMFWWSGGFDEPEPAATGPVTVELPSLPAATGTPAAGTPTAGTPPTGTPTAAPSTAEAPTAGDEVRTVCLALLARLPARLDDHAGRPVAPPAAAERAAAWGDPPTVLRCGVGAPARATGAAQTVGVDGVFWIYQERSDRTVCHLLDRRVAVEVEIPAEYATGALRTLLRPLAAPIAATVPVAD